MFDALLIVSFGGPEGPDDVIPFLQNVTRGRTIPPERLRVVGEHYLRFGGVSPINAQCRALIDRLTVEFAEHHVDLPIYWGNRNWHPLLPDVMQQMRDDGIRRALAFITSPYSSYSSCRQYLDDIARARELVGPGAPEVQRLRHYFDHPGFIEPLSRNVGSALATVAGRDSALLYSAHSIPVAMADASDYEDQLREVARLVTAAAAPGRDWTLVFQSRSGAPGTPWLEPDIGDQLDTIAAAGSRSVVVAPIGFISDHMEVVFDLDVQAAERAAGLGLEFVRAATVGTAPEFVAMIRELVEEQTVSPPPPHRALGRLTRGPYCNPGCCIAREQFSSIHPPPRRLL